MSFGIRCSSIGVICGICLVFLLLLCCGFLSKNCSAASITLSVVDSVSVSVFGGPGGTYALSDTSIDTVSVRTDNPSGYTLNIAAGSGGSNSLIGTIDSSNSIPAISDAYVDESDYSTSSSYNNTWAILPVKKGSSNTGSNIFFRPPNASIGPVQIDRTTEANPSVANKYNIAIGARVDDTVPADSYKNTFIITATVNPFNYKVFYDGNGSDESLLPSNFETTSIDSTYTYTIPTTTFPELEGMAFLGYDTSPSATTPTYAYVNGSFTPSTITLSSNSSSITLYAIFGIPSYSTTKNCTGAYQTVTIPYTGKYRLEVYGAQGGATSGASSTGEQLGGYSVGEAELNSGDVLYIAVGCQGGDGSSSGGGSGGWNGGGGGGKGYSSSYAGGGGGGGATSIQTSLVSDGQLKNYSSTANRQNVLIVAGGGGGINYHLTGTFYGGDGGGTSGGNGAGSDSAVFAGGTQTTGYSFGAGRTATGKTKNAGTLHRGSNYGNGGGGGGWYGGEASTSTGGANTAASGGGGSGYIKSTLTNASTTAGNNSGNGKAVITYVPPSTFSFRYTGSVQTFTAPLSGTYKLEVYGAQGGSVDCNAHFQCDSDLINNQKGGYSKGEIELTAGDVLYVAVGGKGGDGERSTAGAGGWNGGGGGGKSFEENLPRYCGAGGGGATSITTSLIGDGQLKNYSSVKTTQVLIVAGGSGGANWHLNTIVAGAYAYGGNGGGTAGGSASGSEGASSITGGTQSSGYSFGLGQKAADKTSGAGTQHPGSNFGNGGGGGGWYGGYASQSTGGAYTAFSGAGGSGYIKSTLINASTTGGASSRGNGYAVITYMGD